MKEELVKLLLILLLGVILGATVIARLVPNRWMSRMSGEAVVSFTFNLGAGNLYNSTLLKKVNRNPDDPAIRQEFEKWVYADGRVLQGLVDRRKAEADMYFG